MKKFHEFTLRYGTKPIYIRLDSIVGAFENRYNERNCKTVIAVVSGQNYEINEPIDEVMKILEN